MFPPLLPFLGHRNNSGTELVMKWRIQGTQRQGLGSSRQPGREGARMMKTRTSSDPSFLPSQEPLVVEPRAVDLTVSLPGQGAGLEEGPELPASAVNHTLHKIKKTSVVSHQLKRLLKKFKYTKLNQKGGNQLKT